MEKPTLPLDGFILEKEVRTVSREAVRLAALLSHCFQEARNACRAAGPGARVNEHVVSRDRGLDVLANRHLEHGPDLARMP